MESSSELDKRLSVEHKETSSKASNEGVEGVDDIQKVAALDNNEVSLAQIIKSNPVDRWSKSRIKLYLICVVLYLCSTMNGFDGSLMTSINTLPEYVDYFNLSQSPAGTGLVFSIYPIGAMCAITLIWLADYIGRVKAIMVGLVILMAGAIASATTSSHDGFIAARFFISFGGVISLSAAPPYLVEILPPDLKVLSLCFNTFYYVGSIIATWAMYGTSIHFAGTPNAFKIGLWLQLLCPGLVLLCVWSFPESPRFLYSQQKIDKAKDFLIKYHANGDPNHPIVLAELQQIDESFRISGFLRPRDYLDFSVFLKTKARRRRSVIVVIWSWFCQFSGNQVITYYMTTLFLNLGIDNATTRLLLTAVNSIICFIFATAGAFLVEKFGRRPTLLYANAGFVISFICLAVSTKAFSDDSSNTQAASVGIAFIYIFQAVFFSFAMTPLQPTYPSEILSNDMRSRGMALYNLVSNAASTLNLYTAPLAMQNINYWYYVFFVFWDAFQFVIIYFFFVETARLTLEEIEHIFNDTGCVKESIRLSKQAKVKAREDSDPEKA